MEIIENSGRIATVEDALNKPLDFEVSFNLLGWQLRYIDSDFATCITQEQALQVIGSIMLENGKPISGTPFA